MVWGWEDPLCSQPAQVCTLAATSHLGFRGMDLGKPASVCTPVTQRVMIEPLEGHRESQRCWESHMVQLLWQQYGGYSKH